MNRDSPLSPPESLPAVMRMTDKTQLRIAVVCVNNINRSLWIHERLLEQGFYAKSFGISTHVRVPLPGSAHSHRKYPMGTSYRELIADCLQHDREYYKQRGIIDMLERNSRIKTCPERFQDTEENFDVVLACSRRAFETVVATLEQRQHGRKSRVHVLNIGVADTLREAKLAACIAQEMFEEMADTVDFHYEIDYILWRMERRYGIEIRHCCV